jgi:hypothetical protein
MRPALGWVDAQRHASMMTDAQRSTSAESRMLHIHDALVGVRLPPLPNDPRSRPI